MSHVLLTLGSEREREKERGRKKERERAQKSPILSPDFPLKKWLAHFGGNESAPNFPWSKTKKNRPRHRDGNASSTIVVVFRPERLPPLLEALIFFGASFQKTSTSGRAAACVFVEV